jgi:hypothetical protein
VAPDADAGEEVALGESSQVVGLDIVNAPLVNFAGRDVASGNQVAQPLAAERFNLVVVGRHVQPPTPASHRSGSL